MNVYYYEVSEVEGWYLILVVHLVYVTPTMVWPMNFICSKYNLNIGDKRQDVLFNYCIESGENNYSWL